MEKIRVSAVSYLNTRPFIYGLTHSGIYKRIDLSLDIPSKGAEKFIRGETDLALVPAAILAEIQPYQICSRFAIASDGPVESVCLLSQQPLEQVKYLYLDYQSRTSVELTRILIEEYLQLDLEFLHGVPGYENLITDDAAGLVIGDRALRMRSGFKYVYDLGSLWKEFTGLPFVFAVWVCREPLEKSFLSRFDKALHYGVRHIKQVIQAEKPMPGVNYEHYFNHSIRYKLTPTMRQGLDFFLEKVRVQKVY